MVERLRDAIERARASRTDHASATQRLASDSRSTSVAAAAGWAQLADANLDERQLARHRIITLDRSDRAHVAFDMLRTRLLKACKPKNWRRIGITSPTKHCGKSMVAANLAFSLSRAAENRTVLIDMDLRAPSLARTIGVSPPVNTGDFLRGSASVAEFFLRHNNALAIGLNTHSESETAELLQTRAAGVAIEQAMAELTPDLMLFDMPPLLAGDDGVATLPYLDGVLMVVAAGQTRPDEVEESERLLGDACEFLGVILNKHDDGQSDYSYGY